MNQSYKPDYYNSVSPYLIVNNASQTIDFLKYVFGAEEIRRFAGELGRVQHAELRLDDSVIMLGDAVEGWPEVHAHIHIYVPDVDAAFQRALAAGAAAVQEPEQKGDEDRRGGVRDASGTTWWIATRAA
jgi:PhnB protein